MRLLKSWQLPRLRLRRQVRDNSNPNESECDERRVRFEQVAQPAWFFGGCGFRSEFDHYRGGCGILPEIVGYSERHNVCSRVGIGMGWVLFGGCGSITEIP